MLNIMARGGAGLPLVLVHGWTCDHRAMLPVADAFPGRAIVMPDLLGHGASPKSGDYSIGAQADAVLAVAPESAIWVGHSMGAQIAVEAASREPGRVTALVLLDPAAIAPHEAAQAMRAKMQADLEDTAGFASTIERFSRGMLIAPTDAAAVEELVSIQRAADVEATRAGWDAIWGWDGRAALAGVKCPVLVITVEKTMNRLADLARLNRNVTTAQVAGSGHMLQYEVMDQVAAMMRRFFALSGLLSGG